METKDSLDKFSRSQNNENIGIELLYSNKSLDGVEFISTQDVNDYNMQCNELGVDPLTLLADMGIDVDTFHNSMQSQWMIPDHYKEIDIDEYVVHKLPTSPTQEQINRVVEELELYRSRNLYPILRALIYIIDTMRKHEIVWGVGRGSSVASYVLYLLGIHKVDSLKYNLDIKEFLKDE
tara:strand:+ start:7726 stop:8262 length:537 start_codon:yes stop_codon:yes gene_type:complete